MTGIGGDCFVLYSPKGGLPIALNGSGRAPAAASLDWYLEHGFDEIPERSAHAVTVPGAVDAWFRLLADHGTREMAALLQPAIRLAEEGCPVAPRVAYDFTKSCVQIADDPVAAEIFWRGGARSRFGRPDAPAIARRHPAPHRQRGPPGFLRRAGRGGYGASAARARRLAHAGRFLRPACGLRNPDLLKLCRPRGLRVPAQRTGHCRSDDAQHAGGLRSVRQGKKRGRQDSSSGRSDQSCLQGQGRLLLRSRCKSV